MRWGFELRESIFMSSCSCVCARISHTRKGKYVCTQKVLVIIKTSMQEESARVDVCLQSDAKCNNGVNSNSFSLWAPICAPPHIHNVYVGSLPNSSFHTLNLCSLYGVYTILRLEVETRCCGGLCERQRNSCAIHDQQFSFKCSLSIEIKDLTRGGRL